MSENLSDFFNLVAEANKKKKKLKEEEDKFISELIGANNIVENILHELTGKEYENQQELVKNIIEEVEEEVEEISEVVKNIIKEKPKEKIKEKPKEELKENTNKYIKEGLLNIPSDEKNSDSLTPLNQKFATLEDLNKHYNLFLNRIQQQLSTLGGGGETKFRYLDDIVGIKTNPSAYNGGLLVWNSSTNTAGFTTIIGIGTTSILINETLDSVTTRGNTTTNGIGVSFVNLPVGSVISGVSSIIANITRANLSSVLEYGPYANIGIGSYGLTYGITGVPYTVYELQIVPSPTLQLGDIIAGAGISVGSAIIGIGTGTYNKVIITDKTFPVGAGVSPIPYGTEINFARSVVNPGLSIATLDNTDITLNAGAGSNIVSHSDILPYVTNVWSLGSPARRFKEIWFGTGTIYVQDETLGNDQALGARAGNFYIKGGAGLEVGEWVFRDNEIRIKDSTRDVYIGSLGATADVVFNRSIKIQDSTNRTAYYTDRTGRTQYYPPTIPAGDIGGVSIIGSAGGAYQPVINAGGMLHITGNDNAVSRITNDGFGTGVFPAYISRAGRGTAASPSAIVLGDILSRYSTVGFGTTAFPTGPAANNIEVYARENFTNSRQGAEYRFYNAPIGSITKTLDLTINTEGLSFVGTGSTTGITFYDNSRLTYFPSQTAAAADKFLKVTNVAGNYVMSWETPPTITGAVIYKGTYNVVTNTPPVTDATGQAGWEYTVVGVGTTNFGSGSLSLQEGDLLIHNGTRYDQIPGPRTQLNSDWNATTGVTAILNKPTIVNKIIGGTGVTLSPSNGIGTVTIDATGTQNLNSVLTNGNTSALGINVGVVSATSYTGNGVNLTGIVTSIVAGTGGITLSGSTGRVTINGTAQVNSDWTSTVGVASILNKPNIVNQIIAGSGVTISPSNGIGIVTITANQNLNSVLGYGNTSSLGMSVGVVTANFYNGSGTNLTGIVTSIVAGAGITISNSTGQVTINSSGVGGNQLVYVLNASYTLPSVKNTLTSLFGLSNGVALLSNTRYQYELVFNLSSNKTGTLSYGLSLNNGATAAQHDSTYQVNKTTTLGGYSAGITMASSNTVGAAVTTPDTIGDLGLYTHATIYGIIDIITSGNVNFMISQDQNTPITWSVLDGSYIKLTPLGGISTNTSVGTWT